MGGNGTATSLGSYLSKNGGKGGGTEGIATTMYPTGPYTLAYGTGGSGESGNYVIGGPATYAPGSNGESTALPVKISVTPGETINITIGQGGAAGTASTTDYFDICLPIVGSNGFCMIEW